MIVEGIGESEIQEPVHQNEVDEEIKGVDSSDKTKYNERSDRLLLENMM